MISRKKALIMAILLVFVSVAGTLAFQVTLGNKVIISKNEYEELSKFYKLIYLKKEIENNYYKKVDEDKLIEGAQKGLFEGIGDPYSVYYDKKEFAKEMEDTKGSYVGVGLLIGPTDEGGIIVVAPFDGSPAAKAGIKSGDMILKVDGSEVSGKRGGTEKASSMMRGEPGTPVKLTIKRESNNKIEELDLVRAEIDIKTVKSEVLENNIGYLRISHFDEKTAKEFEDNLKGLKSKNIKSLIIDLRDNPGGLVNQSVRIADDLLEKGTVVYTKDRNGKTKYENSAPGKLIDVPIVVLVNEGTASSSEILSGALRDHNAATLIGTKTFGKGIVQAVIPLRDETGYKITVTQYFTPKGESIHKKGIKPKIEIENPDDQLKKAIEVLKEKMK